MAKSKFKKTIIKISCGLLLIVYLIVNGMSSGLISFEAVQAVNANPQKYEISMTANNVTSNKEIKYVNSNTTYNNTAMQKQIKLTSRLTQIGSSSSCDDIEWLHYIVKMEKDCHLQRGELMSLIYSENSFTHKTVMDGGSLSYGCSQMKLSTAMDAYRQIKSTGIQIAEPTENLLRNDKMYLTEFTGRYLQFMHNKLTNPYEVWTSYNKGFGNTQFKNSHYVCQYSNNIFKNMVNFASIIGDAY